MFPQRWANVSSILKCDGGDEIMERIRFPFISGKNDYSEKITTQRT